MLVRESDPIADSGAGRNMFHGTIGTIDLTAGTAVVTLADATNFDDSLDHVLFFERRTHASLQACQTAVYGWNGDSTGLVTDSSAVDSRAIAWG